MPHSRTAVAVLAAAGLCIGAQASEAIRVQLSALDRAQLSSELDARITAVRAREGEVFAKGAELVRFDCRQQRARLVKARALRDAAESHHRITKRLVTLNSSSELELAKAASELAAARADVAVMSAVVERCVVRAPFAGQVVAVSAAAHEYVTAGQPLLDIHDHRLLQAELIVPSAWLAWLRAGERFEIAIDETGSTYPATVSRVGAAVDPVSQSIKVFAAIEGEFPALIPGMSGHAQFRAP